MRKEHRNLLPNEQSSSFQHTLVKVTKTTLDCIFLALLYSYSPIPASCSYNRCAKLFGTLKDNQLLTAKLSQLL